MKQITIARSVVVAVVSAMLAVGPLTATSAALGGFDDVHSRDFYADAVLWMVEEGITTGTTPRTFSPDRELTRGELATFVWRHAGERAGGSHPFTDVASGAFYTTAVAWMYRTDLTTGTTPSTYSPDRTVTRGEAATFLWRLAGEPGGGAHQFTDVAPGAFYDHAIGWMRAEGITTGTSPTRFSPGRALTRAEFATFLHRFEGSPEPRTGGSGGGSGSGGGTPAPRPNVSGAAFFEDFAAEGWKTRFDYDIYHRDEHLGAHDQWPGDHRSTGHGDHCGPPEDKRIIPRGKKSEGFNDLWIYRCVPGGDTALAHLMTSIGDASGYSIGAFAPKEVFTDVTEVRWDVNMTDLGPRQFPEVKIMPVNSFDFQNLPCAIEWLPCDTSMHGQLGSVGTSFMSQSLTINNGNDYIGAESWWKSWMYQNDPALSDIRERRQHYFRDNGNGTLTFGAETPSTGPRAVSTCSGRCRVTPDGNFYEITVPGRFPDGNVRVVFADHNYTPTKDNPATFTWHWDNITVFE